MHRDRQRRPSSRSYGNFANPRDTKRNVVTSGPLSCGDVSRFTLGVGAGTENHDCRVARERSRANGRDERREREVRARGNETEIEGGSGPRSERGAGEIEGESERVDNDPADTNSNYPSGESVPDDRKRKTMFV